MPDISGQIPNFEAMASATGFRLVPGNQIGEVNFEPMELWQSNFAYLALAKFPTDTLESLMEVFERSSEILARIIRTRIGTSNLLDGYLLLVLRTTPDAGMRPNIRRLELNTNICRKHVLYPDEQGSWASTLNCVTTLGFPEMATVSASAEEPVLPEMVESALASLKKKISYREVANEIEEGSDELLAGEPNAD
jgi:hypothetical protein